jgi:hypothetical protein
MPLLLGFTLEKIPSVFGGHFISINIPLRTKEGLTSFFLKMRLK